MSDRQLAALKRRVLAEEKRRLVAWLRWYERYVVSSGPDVRRPR